MGSVLLMAAAEVDLSPEQLHRWVTELSGKSKPEVGTFEFYVCMSSGKAFRTRDETMAFAEETQTGNLAEIVVKVIRSDQSPGWKLHQLFQTYGFGMTSPRR